MRCARPAVIAVVAVAVVPAVVVGVTGCAQPVDPGALGYDVPAAVAFQEAADRDLREDVSPLSAVDAFYLQAGDSLRLAVVDDRVVDEPGPPTVAGLVVSAQAGAVRLVGLGRPEQRSDTTTVVALGRFKLAVGPQSEGARVVVHDPRAAALRAFDRRPWFEPTTAFIVAARLLRDDAGTTVELPTTRGLSKAMPRAGTVALSLAGTRVRLTVFDSGEGKLLLPFTDTTAGAQTYAVGRYVVLDAPTNGDGLVVDFNRATNPWCAYSEFYNCPIPPSDNAIDVAVRAGERWTAAH